MGLVRFCYPAKSAEANDARWGYLVDDEVVSFGPANGGRSASPDEVMAFEQLRTAGGSGGTTERERFDCNDVKFHEPVIPRTIVRSEGCYEHDFTDEGFNPHIEDRGLNELDWPSIWVAPNASLTGPETAISLPRMVSDVRPGVELGVVIGEKIYGTDPEAARDAVVGCTTCASLTAYDELPGPEGFQMFPGFLPCGPEVIQFDDIPTDATLKVEINGSVLDKKALDSLRFTIGDIVSYVSNVMTLHPGDLVLTGDPTRIDRALNAGDELTVEIDPIKSLTNTVQREDDDDE